MIAYLKNYKFTVLWNILALWWTNFPFIICIGRTSLFSKGIHVNFAGDPKYSWFHEQIKNWIYCLYLHFIINI